MTYCFNQLGKIWYANLKTHSKKCSLIYGPIIILLLIIFQFSGINVIIVSNNSLIFIIYFFVLNQFYLSPLLVNGLLLRNSIKKIQFLTDKIIIETFPFFIFKSRMIVIDNFDFFKNIVEIRDINAFNFSIFTYKKNQFYFINNFFELNEEIINNLRIRHLINT